MTTASMTTAPTLTPTSARETFVATMKRDTRDPDLSRLVAVLDAILAWTAARPRLLAMRTEERVRDQLRCERVGSGVVFWSARATRGGAPTLELCPPAGRVLSPELRAHVRETLNAHSREVLADGDRLRIGFGALKNAAACTAVLALMDDILAAERESATPSPA